MLDYFLGNGKWILEILAGLIALVLLNAGVRYGLRSILYRTNIIDERWRGILDRAFWGPFHLLLSILGASYVIRIALQELGLDPIYYTVGRLTDLGILASVSWFIITAVHEWRHRVLSTKGSRRRDRANADLIAKLVSTVLWIPLGLMLLDLLGMPLGGLLALGTVAGGVIAFAARDVTSSIIGGIALYLTRPFVVGDYIVVPDRKIEGVVEEIGWCLTQLRSPDARPVFVPNAVLMLSPQENLTRMSHRLLKEVLFFREQDREQLQNIIRTLQDVLNQSIELDPYMKRVVHIAHNNPMGVEVEIVAYSVEVEEVAYYRVRTAILMRALQALKNLGVAPVYQIGDMALIGSEQC